MEGDNPPPPGESRHPRGKFSTLEDEMLHLLSVAGWDNTSSGNVEAPTGWFARISISDAELPEILEAFHEEFAAVGFDDPHGLVGHFILVENSQGFVDVYEYDSENEVKGAYEELETAFSAWDDQE